MLPPPPQTNRPFATLTPDQERAVLARAANDQIDLFASDPDEQVRRWGRLALRRTKPGADDYFAIGDLCARRSLHGETLLVSYVGRVFHAYKRGAQYGAGAEYDDLLQKSIEKYIGWVLQVALVYGSVRNLATAMWAAAEILPDWQSPAVREAAFAVALQYCQFYMTTTDPTREARRETSEAAAALDSSVAPGHLPEEFETRSVPIVPLGDEVNNGIDDEISDETIRETIEVQSLSESKDESFETQFEDPSPVRPQESTVEHAPSDLTVSDRIEPALPVEELSPADSLELSLLAETDDEPDSQPLRAVPTPDQETSTFAIQEFMVGESIPDPYDSRRSYMVERTLRGGMGVVYICADEKIGERESARIVLKTFQNQILNKNNLRQRFEREAEIWISLGHHPNIVQARRVLGLGSARVESRPHLLLEYIHGDPGIGTDLKAWIVQQRLDLARVLEIGIAICRGMDAAVQKIPGLVHRDLKPGNILIREDGQIKITDFGLASVIAEVIHPPVDDDLSDDPQPAGTGSAQLTSVGQLVGTPAYFSPEQARADVLDLRSDIYAFGAILYEMLTSRQVFTAATTRQWADAHQFSTPSFPTSAAHVPPELKTFTLQLLQKFPDDRPQTWEAVETSLRDLYQGIFGTLPPEAEPERGLQHEEYMDQAYGFTELGRYEDALIAYDHALELAPESAWALSRKARVLLLLDRHEEADRTIDAALQHNPEFGWAWHQKGRIQERLHHTDSALQAFGRAAQHATSPARRTHALKKQARLLLNHRRYSELEPVLDQLRTIDDRDPETWGMVASYYRATKQYVQALRAGEKAAQLSPRDARLLFQRGLILLDMNDPNAAAELFAQAVEIAPRDIWTYYYLSGALLNAGKPDGALTAIDTALDINDKHVYSWSRRGLILRRQGRYKEALGAYDEAIALLESMIENAEGETAGGYLRDSAWLWFHRGTALEDQDRGEEALTSYDHALGIDPNNVTFMLASAEALIHLHRMEDALTMIEAVLSIAPDHARAWSRRGHLLRQMGILNYALESYRQAMQHEPSNRWHYLNAARVLGDLNDMPSSLMLMKKAAEIEPPLSDVWYSYGGALLDAGRYEDAANAFSRALELDPRNGSAKRKRAEALRRLRDPRTES